MVVGNVNTFSDLLIIPLPDLAKRCKISVPDAKAIYDKLLRECPLTELTLLSQVQGELDEIFTTGDGVLDQALGGGVRTGMVWEICGERCAPILTSDCMRAYSSFLDPVPKLGRENPIRSPTLALRSASSSAGRYFWLYVLFDYLGKARNRTTQAAV